MSASTEPAGSCGMVRLHLAFPPALEEAVTRALAMAPEAPEFVVAHAEGHTRDFTRASTREKVRGHVELRMLEALIAHDGLDETLALLRTHAASPLVQWWVEPVMAWGRLA